MASGMISAQQFEAGARSFAALWETCTDAQHLWTWYDSGNALVSSWNPSALDRANKQHALAWIAWCDVGGSAAVRLVSPLALMDA